MELYSIVSIYLFFYKMSVFIFSCFVWFCISYIDRVHAREKTRHLGCIIHKLISESEREIYHTIYNKFRIFILRPLCVLSECITGFIEGIENCEPICKIQYTQQIDSIYIKNEINNDTTPDIIDNNTQTDTSNKIKKISKNITEETTKNITEVTTKNITEEKDVLNKINEHEELKEPDINNEHTDSSNSSDTVEEQTIFKKPTKLNITLVRRRYNNT
jgi:hypothetical protein